MKLTPETTDIICEALRLGATQRTAYEAAGIAESTFYAWKKSHPEFSEAIKKARAGGVLANLQIIREAAENRQWQAAAWILERTHPADYGKRTEDREPKPDQGDGSLERALKNLAERLGSASG